jgi:ribonucleoside-diphosphate reductase subunit M1
MEIVETTDCEKISSCNLASIALDEFVIDGKFDFNLLGMITRKIVHGLNNVIDKTHYPLGDNGIIATP